MRPHCGLEGLSIQHVRVAGASRAVSSGRVRRVHMGSRVDLRARSSWQCHPLCTLLALVPQAMREDVVRVPLPASRWPLPAEK